VVRACFAPRLARRMSIRKLRDNTPRLVRQASTDPLARKELKRRLARRVALYLSELLPAKSISLRRTSELVDLCLSHFDKIFAIYLKNGGSTQADEEYFYQYYFWWTRQIVMQAVQDNPARFLEN